MICEEEKAIKKGGEWKKNTAEWLRQWFGVANISDFL